MRLIEHSPKNEMTSYLLDALVDRASGDSDSAKAKLSDAQNPRVQWVNENERNLLSYAIETIDGVSTLEADELADALVNKQRQSFVLLADVDQVAAENAIARDASALEQYVLAACGVPSETSDGEGWERRPASLRERIPAAHRVGFGWIWTQAESGSGMLAAVVSVCDRTLSSAGLGRQC